jgi:hypothetical protein
MLLLTARALPAMQLMDWLGTTAAANLDSFKCIDDVTNVLYAFHELRHLHPAFLASTRAWLLPRLLDPASSADVAPEALVSVGQAYSTFEAGDREMYSALFGALEGCRRLKGLNPTAGSCLQVRVAACLWWPAVRDAHVSRVLRELALSAQCQ